MLTWAVVSFWKHAMDVVARAGAEGKSATFSYGHDAFLMILATILGDVIVAIFALSRLAALASLVTG